MNIVKLKNSFTKSKFCVFLQNNSTEIFCIICFLAANLYLLSYMYPIDSPLKGHDWRYHYLRIEAVKYNIQNNNMFSGIDYLYFGGGGYASFAYPDIFLYIPALLRVAGFGIGESMAFFILLCNLFSYFFMFIFMKNISGSSICGTVGAVLYVLSNYRIDNIITRVALGEIQAQVFWPLILYGLYDFIFDKFKKPYILGLGFAGMLLSHSISTAMALGLSVLISLIFFKRILQTPKKLLKLLITAGCVVMGTAYYWIPLLELLSSCEMSVKEPAYHTLDNTISFTVLFKESINGGIAGMKFPIFLLCVPRVFLTRRSPISKLYLRDENTGKRNNILVAADVSMVLGIALALMSTTAVPWEILSKFLDFIQFPWRFFGPASILLIIAGTVYIFYIAEFTKTPKTAMVLITAAAILIAYVHADFAGVNHAEPYESDHYAAASETYTVGKGEWLPRAAQDNAKSSLKAMGDNVLLSNDVKIPCERENGTLVFELGDNEGVDFAKLPYIWYKGYEAKDENGAELEITMSDKGLVQVDLHNASGRITVEHKPTSLRIAAYFISALSIISLLTVLIILYRKKRLAALPQG